MIFFSEYAVATSYFQNRFRREAVHESCEGTVMLIPKQSCGTGAMADLVNDIEREHWVKLNETAGAADLPTHLRKQIPIRFLINTTHKNRKFLETVQRFKI